MSKVICVLDCCKVKKKYKILRFVRFDNLWWRVPFRLYQAIKLRLCTGHSERNHILYFVWHQICSLFFIKNFTLNCFYKTTITWLLRGLLKHSDLLYVVSLLSRECVEFLFYEISTRISIITKMSIFCQFNSSY